VCAKKLTDGIIASVIYHRIKPESNEKELKDELIGMIEDWSKSQYVKSVPLLMKEESMIGRICPLAYIGCSV